MALWCEDCVNLRHAVRDRHPSPGSGAAWGPKNTDIIIANVNRGPGRIGNRVVKPGREAIVLAIVAQLQNRRPTQKRARQTSNWP